MARYKQLLYFATKLDPLPKEYHTEDNKVQGCVSQVCSRAKIYLNWYLIVVCGVFIVPLGWYSKHLYKHIGRVPCSISQVYSSIGAGTRIVSF